MPNNMTSALDHNARDEAAVEDALRDARHTLEWTKGGEPGWERGSIELIDKALTSLAAKGKRKGPP